MKALPSITIVDVAKRAAVAPITVSRVVNRSGPVSEATRRRVEAAIAELDYVPNGVARSLARASTRTIAFVQSDIVNPFWATVLRGIEQTASKAGYNTMLYDTPAEDEDGRHFTAQYDREHARRFRDLVGRRVDGVIISSVKVESHLPMLDRAGIPYVFAVHEPDLPHHTSVIGDNIDGARQVTLHLARVGRRRIAFINGPTWISTAADRLRGYRRGIEEAGLPHDPALVSEGDYTPDSGYQQTVSLANRGVEIDGIFAANNFLALGALAALRDRGLRVPEDVGLACFDDIDLAAMIDPFLTVVVEPAHEIGAAAARLLLETVKGKGQADRRVVLPVQMVVRRSCGYRGSRPEGA